MAKQTKESLLPEKEPQSSETAPTENILTGSKLEAQSLYLSPYYSPSYEFPYNPDPLCSGNNYAVYDNMRRDEQIKSVLSLKKSFVVGTGWSIVCEDEEIKDFVTRVFEELHSDSDTGSSFDDVMLDMLSSYDYGFSLSEAIYKLNEENKYIYDDIITRPPHTFLFNIDQRGRILSITQHTAEGDKELKPSVFIHHVNAMQFGNPYGLSDLQAAHMPWKAKHFVDKFFAIYMEKFATPTVVGKYPVGSDTNEVQRMLTILKTIQNNTTLVIPDNAVVDFVQNAKDSGDVYLKALNHYNTRIARALLVPDLMGLSGGETEGGSYALGKTQFDVFKNVIEKDRKSLACKITLKLVQPLVRINFGEGYDVKFDFTPFKQEDTIEMARLWKDAVGASMFDPSDEEINHLRGIVGFPQGPVKRVEKPEDPMGAGRFGGGKPKPGGADAEKKFSQQVATFRMMTQFEEKMDFTQAESFLDANEERIVRKAMSAGKEIYSEYISQLRSSGLLDKFQPEKINTIQPKYLKQMNFVLKSSLKDFFTDSYKRAQEELLPNVPASFAEALLPNEFLDVLSEESFKTVGDYTNDMTKRARAIIVDAFKNGAAGGELIKVLREELGSASETWLRTVLRTKTTDVYNQARRSYWENDEIAKQIVTAYQFSAIMDSRTSEVCSSLDEKIFSINEDIGRITPPLHFNCRSLLVPVTKFESFETSKIPSVAKINDMGGGLKKFEEDDMQVLSASGEASGAGLTMAIAAPGAGARIALTGFTVSNSSSEFPVGFGFTESDGAAVNFMETLKPLAGRTRTFDPRFTISENTPVFIQLYANVPVAYTIEYVVEKLNVEE